MATFGGKGEGDSAGGWGRILHFESGCFLFLLAGGCLAFRGLDLRPELLEPERVLCPKGDQVRQGRQRITWLGEPALLVPFISFAVGTHFTERDVAGGSAWEISRMTGKRGLNGKVSQRGHSGVNRKRKGMPGNYLLVSGAEFHRGRYKNRGRELES